MEFWLEAKAIPTELKTDAGCRTRLARLKWEDGFRCEGEKCDSGDAWVGAHELRVCKKCERHASVTSNTGLREQKLSVGHWVWAAWWTLLTDEPTGSNAEFKKQIQLGSIHTARRVKQLIEAAMQPRTGVVLEGEVQLGTVRVSAQERGCTSAASRGEDRVMVAATVGDNGSAELVRLRRLRRDQGEQEARHGFLEEFVSAEAKIFWDRGFVDALSERAEALLPLPWQKDFRRNESVLGRRSESHALPTVVTIERALRDQLSRTAKKTARKLIRRDQLDHYLLKFQFAFNHQHMDHAERLDELLRRMLALGPNPSDKPRILKGDESAFDRELEERVGPGQSSDSNVAGGECQLKLDLLDPL